MKIAYISPLVIALLVTAVGCGPGKQATSARAKNETATPPPVKRVSFSELAASPKPDVTPQLLEHAAATDLAPASAESSELRKGEQVPDFALTDENGKSVRLSDFRGKAIVLTFIYTRCPLPNFCPLMSKNFQALQERLSKAIPGKYRLLSVSIDPKFDVPEVLKGYAALYHADGQSWNFATGTEEQINEVASLFGLAHEQEGGVISHNLRTSLIGPNGRLVHLWKSNVWTPYEVHRMI